MGANDYCITVARDQALFGFGDAVCVPVISWIAEHYLNPISISNHSASTADAPTERSGDFFIGDTVFHVTMAPGDLVYLKCKRNREAGLRIYLLVPESRLQEAIRRTRPHNLENEVTVKSIESFVGQNIDELGEFSTQLLRQQIKDLIDAYNRRIQVERLAPELRIEEEVVQQENEPLYRLTLNEE